MYKPQQLVLTDFLSHKNSTYDFTSSPILLIGDNKDDSSQKGNGSGKSALIEAISYIITGSTIRSVKDRELIRDECTTSTISLSFKNELLGETLFIKRVLDEKKSATCFILLNGEEVVKSSINEYNTWVLEKFGFSKEDFWNFFLVTKERYSPFFSATDSFKKLIINRFSRADLIDNISFKEKVKQLESDKLLIESSINRLNGQIEILEEQVERQINKTEIESNIQKLDKEICLIESKKEKVESEIVEIKKSIQIILSKKLERDNDLLQEKNSLDIKLKELSSEMSIEKEQSIKIVKDGYNSKKSEVNEVLSSIQSEYDLRQTKLSSYRKELQNLELEKNLIQSKIDGCVECPKCEYQFDITDNLSVVELKEKLDSIKSNISKYGNDISLLDKELTKLELDKKELKEILNSIESSFLVEVRNTEQNIYNKYYKFEEELRSNYNKDLQLIRNLLEELEKNRNLLSIELSDKESELYQSNSSINNLLSEKKILEVKLKDDVIEKLSDFKLLLQGEEQKLSDKKLEIEKESIWELRMKKFKSYLSNLSLRTIKEMVNVFLEKLGSNLTVDIDGYRELSTGKLKEEITCIVIRDGYISSSYGRYSSGERGRVDVSTILTLQQLINLNSKSGGLDLLVVDEVLDSIDSLGMTSIIESLNSFKKNIILVSQNEIISQNSRIVTVRKENRVSNIII